MIYMQERTLGQAFSLDTFIFSPSLADRGTKKRAKSVLMTSPFWPGSTRGRGIESAVGPGLHSILLSGERAAGASAITAPRSADVPQGLSALHVVILQLKADLIGCSCTKAGRHPHTHTHTHTGMSTNREPGSKLSPRPKTMPPKKRRKTDT